MIQIGPEESGRPTKAGIYVVRFKGEPGELFCWFDGGSFGHGHVDAAGAKGDKPLFGRLGDSRIDRRPVIYWRTYSAKVDWLALLKKALGG